MEKELLYRFFNGEVTTGEEKRVLDWLEADPAHRQELLAERRLFDAALLLAPRTTARTAWRLPRWTREVAKYAAVLLLAAGVGGAYLTQLHERLSQSFNTISVPAGQRVNLTLADGTQVCMNALSELTYPAYFAGGERKVKLRGEAFFDVSHDASHPFVVETFACDVEVLGTRFDVEARPESGEFTTSLVEGRVRVKDKKDTRHSVVLQPSQQAAHVDGRLVVGSIPAGEQFLWREGLIAFRDASFEELLAEFEKYYGVQIEMQRKNVTGKLFTGKIRISEGVDHALWVLQRSADFTYLRNDTKDTIYIQ
ncbi:FecR family protein [Alistipes sp.]|uniref:FecR family protein n=1 Tax=Alistipes sp. TaxID=1872444 RepID=UPI003AF078DE